MSSEQLRFTQVGEETPVETYKAVYEEVWRRGEPFAEGELDPGDGSLRYVGRLGSEPVCGFKVHRYQVQAYGVSMPCAGIASVGVRPTHRNAHFGRTMMEWALQEMRQQGFWVSALYPFREPYYRQFGFLTCGFRWQIRCPMDRFPALQPDLPVRRIAPESVAELDGCYRAFIESLNGANLRTPAQWTSRLGKRPPMIYTVGDPIEAYAWTSMGGEFWEDLSIGEFAWSTERGYRSMLAFFRSLGINRSAIIWNEPSAGPFFEHFLDQGVEIKAHRLAMYRVLNAPEVVRAVIGRILPDTPQGGLGLRVSDPLLPENNGDWEIMAGADPVHREVTIDELTRWLFPDPMVPAGPVWRSDGEPDLWDEVVSRSSARATYCTEFF